MGMKVPGQDPIKFLETHLLGPQGATEQSGARSGSTSSAQTDSVEISGKAKEIQRLTQSVAQVPDSRASQVSAVQGAVESGTYNVQGQKIAEKLVQNALLDQIL